jgi:hypothetical protein
MSHYKIKPFHAKQENNIGLGIEFWRQSKRLSNTEREWDLSIKVGYYNFGIFKEEVFNA